ncbi:hypothetical protein BDZ91DRAFT_736534 [Kalaharituber pfeilii]|nr:hypothetical protein BDZ91DRAFT_736534 [Kalaharituber pfeilii]
MSESNFWNASAIREQIIDNVFAMGRISVRANAAVVIIKNDAGYQALMSSGGGLKLQYGYTADILFKSIYCNNATQALKSLLDVVQAAAWRARERGMVYSDTMELEARRSQLSCIHPRPIF